jgi:hypothetical protein
MNRKTLSRIIWILLAILLALSLYSNYLLVSEKNVLDNMIATKLDSIKIPIPKDGKDGYTPIKGVDYFDGTNGKNATNSQIQQAVGNYLAVHPVQNGTDGKNGTNATDSQVQQAVNNYMDTHPITNGKDGDTPQIQCDPVRNLWEMRYTGTDNWQLLNGSKVKCTI